jgi:hypothetical protein
MEMKNSTGYIVFHRKHIGRIMEDHFTYVLVKALYIFDFW